MRLAGKELSSTVIFTGTVCESGMRIFEKTKNFIMKMIAGESSIHHFNTDIIDTYQVSLY